MRITRKIKDNPSDEQLSKALFSGRNGLHIRVAFTLDDDSQVACTVVSINTDQGLLLVRGSWADTDGNLAGFYEANLVGNKIFIFK